MVYNIQNYWVFGLCPSSGIPDEKFSSKNEGGGGGGFQLDHSEQKRDFLENV
jgi:hypothetical protein